MSKKFEDKFEQFRHGLHKASLLHWIETGKVSGTLMLAIQEYEQELRSGASTQDAPEDGGTKPPTVPTKPPGG